MHLVLWGKSPFRYKRLFSYIQLGYNGSLLYLQIELCINY